MSRDHPEPPELRFGLSIVTIEPLGGRLDTPSGEHVPFAGWMGLAVAIEEELEKARREA